MLRARRGQMEPLAPTKPALAPGVRAAAAAAACGQDGVSGGTAGTCSAPGLGCLHRHKQEKAVLTETDTKLVFIVFF